MKCPKCGEPMVVLELHDVEIDHCLDCQGIWLDAGELELLITDSQNKEPFLDTFKVEKNCPEKKRKCPICLKKMEKVLCGTDQSTRIDRCVRGDGLWFDSGELEEVVQMSVKDSDSEVLKLIQDMFGKKLKEV